MTQKFVTEESTKIYLIERKTEEFTIFTVLSPGESLHKVTISPRIICTCLTLPKDNTLMCKHMIFVLMKILKVDKSQLRTTYSLEEIKYILEEISVPNQCMICCDIIDDSINEILKCITCGKKVHQNCNNLRHKVLGKFSCISCGSYIPVVEKINESNPINL
jgi:hypothetical protein